MILCWKFYWLGVIIFAELHIYSQYFRYDTDKYREIFPNHAFFVFNFHNWKMSNMTPYPNSGSLSQLFLGPHLFESHKKMMRFRDDLFHKDTKEGEYWLRNRIHNTDFIELRKFNLVEFTRMFALI
jgi:hypothetical protein